MRPAVITVAITGSVPRKKDNPAVPVTVSEQVESTHEAFEAGASLVHIHVRNPDESSSSDPGAVRPGAGGHPQALPRHDRAVLDRRARPRPGGARQRAVPEARHGVALHRLGQLPDHRLRELAGLVVDLATTMHDHGVRPEIEVFDLSHLHGARRLVDAGLMSDRPHVQFVMGVKNAMPAEEHLLDILLGELKRVLPKATWTAAGIGRHQAK